MKVLIASLLVLSLLATVNGSRVPHEHSSAGSQHAHSGHFHLVYAACGAGALQEALVGIKSLCIAVQALPPSEEQNKYTIHILTDQDLQTEEVQRLQKEPSFKIVGHAVKTDAPDMFKPCASQRLYMHEHADFQDTSEVMWIDVDTLWLAAMSDMKEIHREFAERGALFGIVVESSHVTAGRSWYLNQGAGTARYGDAGLNDGVLLMSLDRIRVSNFSQERDSILEEHLPQGRLPLGDQDLLNMYGHEHPKHMYELPCTYNFRYSAGCFDGHPIIMHGNDHLRTAATKTYGSLYRMFSKINIENFSEEASH